MLKKFVLVFVVCIPLATLGYGIAWYLGYLPTRVDDLTYVSVGPFYGNRANNIDQYVVRFRSSENLRKATGGQGIFATFSLCPFRDNPSVSVSRVTHNNIDLGTMPTQICQYFQGKPNTNCRMVDDTPEVHAELASINQKGPFIYEAYFSYNELCENIDHKICARTMSLPHPPVDLCVQLGGTFGPPGFTSNVIRIPKEDLTRALATRRTTPSHN
jgi:hypothetical protein